MQMHRAQLQESARNAELQQVSLGFHVASVHLEGVCWYSCSTQYRSVRVPSIARHASICLYITHLVFTFVLVVSTHHGFYLSHSTGMNCRRLRKLLMQLAAVQKDMAGMKGSNPDQSIVAPLGTLEVYKNDVLCWQQGLSISQSGHHRLTSVQQCYIRVGASLV